MRKSDIDFAVTNPPKTPKPREGMQGGSGVAVIIILAIANKRGRQSQKREFTAVFD